MGANVLTCLFNQKCCDVCGKVSQMDFDIQSLNQRCSVMHEWMIINDVSLESILIILCDKYIHIVINPTTWTNHYIVSGFCFIWDTLYITYFL